MVTVPLPVSVTVAPEIVAAPATTVNDTGSPEYANLFIAKGSSVAILSGIASKLIYDGLNFQISLP